MNETSPVNQNYRLWILLDQVANVIQKARVKELRQFGISHTHATVLSLINAIGDEATPVEISRRLLRASHTVSSLLQRMEGEGLVRRCKDLDRKNLIRVVITEKGQQYLDQAKKGEVIDYIISTLSLEEKQQIISCLGKLLRSGLNGLGMEDKLPLLKSQ